MGQPIDLTHHEARVILRLYRHWPKCQLSCVMTGEESAAWICMVSAAHTRVCTCEHKQGPHDDICFSRTFAK